MFDEYDLVILGGGAAAFAAITEARSRGLSTAMVNTGLPIGGTCVNVGCVPSKRLLALGENAATPQENPFGAVQYSDGEPTVDWARALDGTDDLVEGFRRENYVDVAEHFETDIYEGYGELIADTTIEVVDGPDEGTRITGEKALVATGSSPGRRPSTASRTLTSEARQPIRHSLMTSTTTPARPSSKSVISPRASSCSAAGTSRSNGARSSTASGST